MEDSLSLFFTIDFKNNSLLISSDEGYIQEEYYGISTRDNQEILELTKKSIINFIEKYKKMRLKD